MKHPIHLLAPLVVVAFFSLAGISCTQTDQLPEGETTTDIPEETLSTPDASDATTSNDSFTVDLVPEGEDASETGLTTADDVEGATAPDATDTTDAADDKSAADDSEDTDLTDLIAAPVEEDIEAPSEDAEASDEETKVLALAETLTEIHGTFTNKDKEQFQNYTDLEPYITEDMKAYLDSVKSGVTVDPNDPFFGRTTTALSSAITAMKGTTATVLVTSKQEDITGTSASPTTTYILKRLEFTQKSDEWLLSGIYEVDTTKPQP